MSADASIVEVMLREGCVRLTVSGALDLATGPRLEAALLPHRAAGRAVTLDLSKVDFIDSTGLAVLLRTERDTRTRAWSVTLLPILSLQVRSLLESSGLPTLLMAPPAGTDALQRHAAFGARRQLPEAESGEGP